MVGKIQPEFFPKVFGKTANEALDDEVVREKFAVLAMEVEEATGRALSPEQLADGYSTSPSATWPKRSSASRSSAATM